MREHHLVLPLLICGWHYRRVLVRRIAILDTMQLSLCRHKTNYCYVVTTAVGSMHLIVLCTPKRTRSKIRSTNVNSGGVVRLNVLRNTKLRNSTIWGTHFVRFFPVLWHNHNYLFCTLPYIAYKHHKVAQRSIKLTWIYCCRMPLYTLYHKIVLMAEVMHRPFTKTNG